MNLYGFFALRGWKLSDLAALSEPEKLFLAAVRDEYLAEQTENA